MYHTFHTVFLYVIVLTQQEVYFHVQLVILFSVFQTLSFGLENMRHPLSLLKEYVYASVNDEFNEFNNG